MSDESFNVEELLRIWSAESEENLTTMEQTLIVLENAPGDQEVLHTIFRAAHTLKGNSASVGFTHLAAFAHRMEDLLDRLRSGRTAVSSEIITTLLRAVDVMRGLVPAALAGATELPASAMELIDRLAAIGEGAMNGDVAAVVAQQPAIPAASARRLRVDLDKLDVLLNLTGEMTIAAGRLQRALDLAGASANVAVGEAYAEVEQRLAEIQEQVTRIRMVPVGPRLEQQARTIRDLAQSKNRQVRLAVEGGDVELDASIVEQLKDPLTHMIRNAVDHGVETPEVRRQRGKDPVATITLGARHDGGAVAIFVRDDGAGFNRERIAARARQRGFIAEGAALTDEEVHRIVFLPGFSTAEEVSETSGRGVGMDVVQRNISALRGTISIRSEEGKGSTISIRLPLTLAIIDGLAVWAGSERFIVPMQAVEECARMDSAMRAAGTTGIIHHRGQPLPVIRLRKMLGTDDGRVTPRENLVVVRSAAGAAGIIADDLVGEVHAVIKPMGKLLQRVAGVAGSTIFNDGGVGFILDVPSLIEAARG